MVGRLDERGQASPNEVEPSDWLLSSFLAAFMFLKRRVIPYGALLKRWRGGGRESGHFAPFYVLAWLLLLVTAYSFSPLWVGGAGELVPVLVVAAWRYLDIVVWYLDMLVRSTHRLFAPVERNVLFVIFNLFELVFIAAIFLRAANESRSIADAWFGSFFLTTLINIPRRANFWDGAAQVAGASGGFVVIAGGLAIVVSVIATRFRSGGPHLGPSHARDE